jgi:uncharacterized repeat protein (TIGR03843 family)
MDVNNSLKLSNGLLSTIKAIRQLGRSGHHSPVFDPEADTILRLLVEANLDLHGLMPWSSNYTFLVSLEDAAKQASLLAVYKPCAGERPLWDFPSGNLCYREFVSYLVSQVLGWPNIPPTVLRDGPHGEGSVQLFIEAEYEAHYFNMRDTSAFTPEFRGIALFDYIVNNADRKGGHCLKDKHGQLWAIDHGLTFHPDYKLRTVIWDFCSESIPEPLLEDLTRLQKLLDKKSELQQTLKQYLNQQEIRALKRRVDYLLSRGHFPDMHPGRNIPYPPI